MDFITTVPIQEIENKINYQSKVLSFGSCFAENMGQLLCFYQFQSVINPFGIIFNPVSIEKLIQRALLDSVFTKDDLFFHNELWHSFEVHSELSHSNPDELVIHLNHVLSNTKKQLLEATHVIVTFGTSWVYRHIETNAIVANCHKVPQKYFQKELLSITTIQQSIENIVGLIQKYNPNCNFIFTVSPVRHLKDGFVENQVSKAHLIASIYPIVSQNVGEISYFPSYEIMMDELRDYRFYANDMLHPSPLAIDFIWERFTATHINSNAKPIMDMVQTIRKEQAHRPFNPQSLSHQKFEAKLKEKIAKLEAQYSFMKF